MANNGAQSSATAVCITSLVAAASQKASRGLQRNQSYSPTTGTELISALRDICGKPATASWLVAAGVNAAVLGYVSYKLYRNAVVQHDKYKQLRRAEKRLWRLATQGGAAAGPVPEDLGEPDAAGVYTYSTVTGTLFFRQTQPHPFAAPHWEWSTDKALWIPTSFADSLWYSSEASPSTADKVLIRRLEVEGHLLARQGSNSAAAAAGAMLPPLDVSQSRRDLSCLMTVPTAFLCPISMCLMTQPVVTPSGATFDRPALLDWIRQTHTDPLSGQPLSSDQLVPNLVLRDMIHAWMLQDDADASTSASTSSAAKEVTAAAPEHSTCVVQESPVLPTVECLDSSSCKAGKVACITDCRVGSGSLKDALIPGTPGRASRDV